MKIFIQDKKNRHGKADACHGDFVQYLDKKIAFEANTVLRGPAFGGVFFILANTEFANIMPNFFFLYL